MSDEARIRDVVHRLVNALAQGDTSELIACFYPQATIIATDGRAVQSMNVEDYAAALPTTVAATSPPGSPDLTIFDITDKVAIAKLIDRFDGRSFTGHLALICLAGNWQITGMNYQLRS